MVFTPGYAIFHVNKFSTYAIGYTRYASNPITNPATVKDQETSVFQWLIKDDHISYMRGDHHSWFNLDKICPWLRWPSSTTCFARR